MVDHLRPKVLATLIRVLGDVDLAEDATQEAFLAASKQWAIDGAPQNPLAWLISIGRNKGIDQLRKSVRMHILVDEPITVDLDPQAVEDDQLRLVFMCCHPGLPTEGQVALTLREVCGLSTEETAKAFLVSTETVAQRIVRAKAKIRADKLPYEIPSAEELPARLAAVLNVVYLVFNEGYYASSGRDVLRTDLSAEAIRLARLLANLLPRAEVFGLLALMLLNDSRKEARFNNQGDIVLLSDQDRSLWNATERQEGLKWLALAEDSPHSYVIQARIAAAHMQDRSDWELVCQLYDQLVAGSNSPVVRLNRAIAIAMRDSPHAGIELIDELIAEGHLNRYGLAHSARAELCFRSGRLEEALQGFEKALELAEQEPERRHLLRQIAKTKEKSSDTLSN